MKNPDIVRMSSNGRVTIPLKIRNRPGLRAGMRFVAISEQDTILLNPIKEPSMEEFDELIAKARAQTREAGLKSGDIRKAVKEVRRDDEEAEETDNE
jgi:bifunctional DNA-binding transcriptional regulator/antitoxin component of YhaV-PrlF toxin-antitoxin module